MRRVALLALAVVLVGLMASVYHIHPYGYPNQTAMDDYFIMHGQNETGNNNIITSIVFDYRGFDTLGEAVVLFSAVVGVAMILRRRDE